MACGTPVIASRTAGDAPHVLDNGRFGELIDPLDEAQLAEAILRQTGDRPIGPGERAKLFDRGKSLAAYIKLFGQVIGRPEGRPLNIDERKPDALGQGRNLRISGRRP
jgi:glycosyltransferase involved in cell wall biosynthesis